MPSSVVSRITYDRASSRLRIVYLSGLVYDYLDVPEEVFLAMKKAGSKGNFLNTEIKGRYEFEKVEAKNES